MQPDHHWPDRTLARFMQASRQHFGLTRAPMAVRPPRRIAGPRRQTNPAKRNQNAYSPRIRGDDRPAHAHRLSLPGKHR